MLGNDFEYTHQNNGLLNIDKFVCTSSKRPYFVKSCQLYMHKIINSTIRLSKDYFRKIMKLKLLLPVSRSSV